MLQPFRRQRLLSLLLNICLILKFKKDLSLDKMSCPRIYLNFMTQTNHIAKQHIVSQIKGSNHFTYGTDGTSRSKKHYMEHYIVLDNV